MDISIFFYYFSYLFQSFGNLWLCYIISKKKVSEGISYYTQIIYLVAACVKLLTIFEEEIYGNIIGILDVLLFFVSNCFLFHNVKTYKKNNYTIENYKYEHYIIIFISFVATFFACPSKFQEGEYIDFFLVFIIILECLGMIPQIKLIKKNNIIQNYLGKYIVLLTVGRVCRIIFWYLITSFTDRSLYLIIFLDFLNIIFISNVLYHYLKNVNKDMIPYNN